MRPSIHKLTLYFLGLLNKNIKKKKSTGLTRVIPSHPSLDYLKLGRGLGSPGSHFNSRAGSGFIFIGKTHVKYFEIFFMKNITKNCFALEIILRSFWYHRLFVWENGLKRSIWNRNYHLFGFWEICICWFVNSRLLVLIKICFSYKEDSSFTSENADTNFIFIWNHLSPWSGLLFLLFLEYKGMMPFPLSLSSCLDGIGSSSLQKILFLRNSSLLCGKRCKGLQQWKCVG